MFLGLRNLREGEERQKLQVWVWVVVELIDCKDHVKPSPRRKDPRA